MLFPTNFAANTEKIKPNTTKATIPQEHKQDNIKQNTHKN